MPVGSPQSPNIDEIGVIPSRLLEYVSGQVV